MAAVATITVTATGDRERPPIETLLLCTRSFIRALSASLSLVVHAKMRKGLVAKAESILAKLIYEGFFYGRMSWSSREEEKRTRGALTNPPLLAVS